MPCPAWRRPCWEPRSARWTSSTTARMVRHPQTTDSARQARPLSHPGRVVMGRAPTRGPKGLDESCLVSGPLFPQLYGESAGPWVQCLPRSFSGARNEAEPPTGPGHMQGLPHHRPSPVSPVSWLSTLSLSAPAVRQLGRKLTFPYLRLLWGLGEESPPQGLWSQARHGGGWLEKRAG